MLAAYPSMPSRMMVRMTRLGLSIFLIAWWCGVAFAQEPKPATLRLGGMLPGGVATLATSSWQTYDFNLTNLTDIDRQARVLMHFPGRSDVQFGRDVWVPARSTINSWLLAGP